MENMSISQQRLHKLEIKKLKNIKDFCISFESKNLTGILGPNGYGKSTILHALACCFQPPTQEQKDYKFSDFFLPSPDALWKGSELRDSQKIIDPLFTLEITGIAHSYSSNFLK